MLAQEIKVTRTHKKLQVLIWLKCWMFQRFSTRVRLARASARRNCQPIPVLWVLSTKRWHATWTVYSKLSTWLPSSATQSTGAVTSAHDVRMCAKYSSDILCCRWVFDGGQEEAVKSIPYQLQRLFLQLQVSTVISRATPSPSHKWELTTNEPTSSSV